MEFMSSLQIRPCVLNTTEIIEERGPGMNLGKIMSRPELTEWFIKGCELPSVSTVCFCPSVSALFCWNRTGIFVRVIFIFQVAMEVVRWDNSFLYSHERRNCVSS